MKSRRVRNLQELEALREERQAALKKEKRRVYLCTGGSCVSSGSEAIRTALDAALSEAELDVEIVETGCMGPCASGPLLRVEPEGVLYRNLTPQDADSIVHGHLREGNLNRERLFDTASGGKAGSIEEIPFFQGQHRLVLRNCGVIDPLRIDDYIASGGYSGLAKAVTELSPPELISVIEHSGLKGRGGAGFPTFLKWRLTAESKGDERFVLCNADEGDPGAFMDRSLLEGDPHSVIEGMALAAYAVGAREGYVYVRAEYPLAVERLQAALAAAEEAGLLGDNILGTGFSFRLGIRRGSGAFVCGEETALIHSIEGSRGEPKPRPPFPAQSGLWGKPTLLNNVETYGSVSYIVAKGAEEYASLGTEQSKGTKVFALAGAVENTGLVEVPIGTTLGELIYDIGGGIRDGKEFKAAQIGGPSGGCIPREYLNVPLDYKSLQELGAIMGSGGLIVMDDDTCMVDVARFFLEFVQEESCGKCAPCRVGTKRMLEILERICNGEGEMEDLTRLEELGQEIQETALCGLGQTAPNPVLSTLRHFRHEYEEHIRDHHCTAGVCPGLVRAPCQSACPAGVDVPGFVSLVGEKRYAEALRLHRERNPFAAVCARVCFHTCEDKCRRASLDDAVSIRAIKRFMVDQEIVVQLPEARENETNAKRKIGIVGGGPAGLSCGYFLARLGYRPVIFEAQPRPGGMLVQAIPEYRLPRETLAREIRMIERLGVEIRTEQKLGREFTLESLKEEGYEALFMGVGAAACVGLDVPGGEGSGIVEAGEFLRQYNVRGSVPVGKEVIVVGGGNAAVDAARTAVRLGADVTILYRRTREQMPAYSEEIEEALHEGVKLLILTQPEEVLRDESGAITSVRCRPLSLGEFDRSGRRRPRPGEGSLFDLTADQVIVAIGQRLDIPGVAGNGQSSPDQYAVALEHNDSNFIAADPVTGQTSVPWIFAGGDAVSGPSSVVEAIAAGERAAYGIDLMLTGEDHAFWREEKVVDTAFDPDADPVPYPRELMSTIPVERRRHNFDEVELPWCEAVALRQAKRCLRCDYGKCGVLEVHHA
ncbi:MAG: NADH-ubiquinone oxidoreductase-F iron-sulfur binding region domain-containing protein [Alkalispirochaetaceae bacterium]